MKKTLLLLTAFLTFAAGSAQAVGDAHVEGDINFVITSTFPDPDEVGVTGMDVPVANVSIPAEVTIGGFPFAVTSIKIGAFSCNTAANKGAGKVENLVIESVSLPSSVTIFEAHAFRDNPNLTTINLENVVDLGSNTFVSGGLTGEFDLPACIDLGSYAFFACSKITGVNIPIVEICDAGSLYRMDAVREFNVPASVTNVGTLFLGDTDGSNSLEQVQLNWDATQLAAVTFANDTKFFRNRWQEGGGAEGDDFTGTSLNIYVPAGSKAAYEAHPSWGKFPSENIIEGDMPPLLGTNDVVAQELGFSVYPNPASDVVSIKNSKLTNAEVTVFDLNGRALLTSALNATVSEVNISSLTAGIYLFKVKAGNSEFTKRIVKQ